MMTATILVACGGGEVDKKAALDALKKQKNELEIQIAALEKEVAANDTGKSKITLVGVETLAPSFFKSYINIQGKVDADENVSLSAEMPGTVTKINVKPGDEVSKGQVLAETDARAVQQQLASLQSSYDLIVQLYEKQKSLWDQKIGTEVQFLQAKAQKESMEKQIAAVQEQIKMTRITSPIDGTVDAVDVKLGQLTAPGMPAIRVVNFNNLKVKAELAETYASRVKRGDEVFITFPDLSDSVRAKVSYAARSINALHRTFTVEINLDNKKEYHPNMVTRLSINDYTSKTPIVIIPLNTITKGEDGTRFVYIAKGDKAEKRIVKTGKEYNGKCEVTEGLTEGDALIVDGFESLNEGALITVKK